MGDEEEESKNCKVLVRHARGRLHDASLDLAAVQSKETMCNEREVVCTLGYILSRVTSTENHAQNFN